MTKNEVIAQLKKDNPVLREGSEEQGYTELTPAEYDARIAEWADNILAKEAAEVAKAAAAAAKAALLQKLGITEEEAKLLFV
jgi:hypothetical protein